MAGNVVLHAPAIVCADGTDRSALERTERETVRVADHFGLFAQRGAFCIAERAFACADEVFLRRAVGSAGYVQWCDYIFRFFESTRVRGGMHRFGDRRAAVLRVARHVVLWRN